MSLQSIAPMLSKARAGKYAVGAFDVSDCDMAAAVVEAAEEKNSPVILMGLCADLQGNRLEYWLGPIRKIAERAAVPVCVHLDHAVDFEMIKQCIDGGFTSVMYDGSTLPLEENMEQTRKVAQYAHRRGVGVEAELGHVGDGIVGGSETGQEKTSYDKPEDFLTCPGELKRFIDVTKVDCIAVAVGTAHGIYVHEPNINFDLLARLNAISTVPMVMHGGSGTPDELIRKSVAGGVCKLNIFSEMLTAYNTVLKRELGESAHLAVWPSKARKNPLKALQAVVRAKIDLVGSAGKA